MRKNIMFLSMLLGMILSLVMVNGADFSLTPNSIDKDVYVGESLSYQIEVKNEDNQTNNYTISATDLSSGSVDINVDLDKNQINNLVNGSQEVFNISFDTGDNLGRFDGEISVSDGNTTQKVSLRFDIDLKDTNQENVSLSFLGEPDDRLEIVMEKDSSESENFILINDGQEILKDIDMFIEDDFEGDDTRDEIDLDDVEINNDEIGEFDKISSLGVYNNISFLNESIRIEFNDIGNIDVDYYTADLVVRAKRENGNWFQKTFQIRVRVESDEDEEIQIDRNNGDFVGYDVIYVPIEPGDVEDDVEITIENDGDYDVEDIEVDLEDDLEEENSNYVLSKSAFKFYGTPLDIDENDEEEVDIEISIPEDQPIGTYFGTLEVKNSEGKVLDEMVFKVKVVGDIYIDDIQISSKNVLPGDSVSVKVDVRNQGNKVYRNVKVYGTLLNADVGNTDIEESSSNFVLGINDDKEVELRFLIPKEANDGEHTLEIRVDYGENEVTELEEINIERPDHNIFIESYAINPGVAKCEDNLFTYIRFKNLGKFDERVKVRAKVKGTNIGSETNYFDFNVDDVTQESLTLDVSDLEEGNYDVEFNIYYSNDEYLVRTSNLKVLNCSDYEGGVTIKPINETDKNQTEDYDGYEFFGQKVDKTTTYLGAGVLSVVVLIGIGLFFI